MNDQARSKPGSGPIRKIARAILAQTAFTTVKAVFGLFQLLGPSAAFCLAQILSPIFLLPTAPFRQRNFKRLLGPQGWTAGQYLRLHLAHGRYLSRLAVEISRLFAMSRAELAQKVSLAGEEHLRAALEKGRGVLLLSGHTGIWWHLPGILALRGYDVTAVFASAPARGWEEYFTALAGRFGVKLTFLGNGAGKTARQVFQRNGIFYLVFDLPVRESRHPWVQFGDAAINLDHAPAVLASRYGVPVLQAESFQTGSGLSQITLEPAAGPCAKQVNDSHEEALRRWIEQLKRQITAHPEQWWLWNIARLRDAEVLAPKAESAQCDSPGWSERRERRPGPATFKTPPAL